jgi:mono/diheme cytochrome c family protein
MNGSYMRPRFVAAGSFVFWLGCARAAHQAPPIEVDVPAPGASVEPTSVAAPATPPTAQTLAPGDTVADRLLATETEYQGWKYFAVYCERCHGPDALGTVDAPDLRYSVSPEGEVTADSFRVIVRKGTENREENKVMKGFEELLDDERIDQLYAYVKARSEGRLAAGRPHRAPAH